MAAYFHDGFWAIKALAVTGGYIASFWIKADFFTGFFMPAATWIAALFLLFQALLMLEVAYKINNTVVGNYNKQQSCCNSSIMLLFGFGTMALNVFLIVYQFTEFKCFKNVIFQIITIIGILGMYAIATVFKTRLRVR
jgi:hypothetical protein